MADLTYNQSDLVVSITDETNGPVAVKAASTAAAAARVISLSGRFFGAL